MPRSHSITLLMYCTQTNKRRQGTLCWLASVAVVSGDRVCYRVPNPWPFGCTGGDALLVALMNAQA